RMNLMLIVNLLIVKAWFSRLNVPIKTNLGRFMFYKERLPLLLSDNDNIHLAAGYEAIVDHCKRSHIDIDEQFHANIADLLALHALVKSAFVPAVLDTFWLDNTYRSSIINIYARSLGGFPLAFFYDHLTILLGTKPFLFGASPTSIDAFVFGYLAPLIHGPASNSALARYASSRKNIRDFVDRILTIYLSDLAKDNDTTNSVSTTISTTSNEDRLRDKIAVIAVGVLTMCAYAYLSGLIRIEINQVE
ncbi:unnamed protein product, partial [Rotaria sp. Silwood2]